jgi:hypothetical protein
LSQDDVNNCHDLLGDLVDNESEPGTGYSGLGAGAGMFSINVMNLVMLFTGFQISSLMISGFLGRVKKLRRSLNSITTLYHCLEGSQGKRGVGRVD